MAQRISFEVVMSLVVLCGVYVVGVLRVRSAKSWQINLFIIAGAYIPLFLVWLVCILAESNRAPFDFVEGESELVSGYNGEFRAGGFGLLYITEYSGILLNRIFSAAVYFGGRDVFVRIVALFFFFFYI